MVQKHLATAYSSYLIELANNPSQAQIPLPNAVFVNPLYPQCTQMRLKASLKQNFTNELLLSQYISKSDYESGASNEDYY